CWYVLFAIRGHYRMARVLHFRFEAALRPLRVNVTAPNRTYATTPIRLRQTITPSHVAAK
ncbi:hypothetical protein, partial [Burkholderia ubonensis]